MNFSNSPVQIYGIYSSSAVSTGKKVKSQKHSSQVVWSSDIIQCKM